MTCECARVVITTRHSSLRLIRLTNDDLSAIKYNTVLPLTPPGILKRVRVVSSSANATGLTATFGLFESLKTTPTITVAQNLATAITTDQNLSLLGDSANYERVAVKVAGTVPANYTVDINVEVI